MRERVVQYSQIDSIGVSGDKESPLVPMVRLIPIENAGGGRYFQKKWVGMCGTLLETLAVFQAKTVWSPNDEEAANSSKKHAQFKTRVHQPYPISDRNGRN